MKKSEIIMAACILAMAGNAAEIDKPAVSAGAGQAIAVQQPQDEIQKAVGAYFADVFAKFKEVADKKPTVDTYREAMKPMADKMEGLYGATFIDTNFVIRQVYHASHFLAKGFDLKKVKELDYFWDQMRKTPEPQVSEPGHGSLIQPRLIAMRYPVVTDGKLQAVVSIMVRTEVFLKAVGLDKCQAYKITCRGTLAEENGDLKTGDVKSFNISLPSNDWKIEYKK